MEFGATTLTDRKRLLVDGDRLANASRVAVARMCVQLFSAIQNYEHKEDQLLALAAAFLLMAEVSGVPAQEAFTYVKNLMWDPIHADRMDHRFAAMKYHLETELMR